ncbi:MAG: hypothetical protein QXH81_05715 [Thermofilaceae archaeon]
MRTVAIKSFTEGRLEGAVRIYVHTLPTTSGALRLGTVVSWPGWTGSGEGVGEPTDLRWELPQPEKWFPFPLGAVERILRVAWRDWLMNDLIRFEVREGRMRVSGCGLSYTTLTGCEGEYKVALRLRTLADALRAFKIAGLLPGSIGFAPMKLLTLVQLKGGWLKAYIAPVVE